MIGKIKMQVLERNEPSIDKIQLAHMLAHHENIEHDEACRFCFENTSTLNDPLVKACKCKLFKIYNFRYRIIVMDTFELFKRLGKK